MISTQNPDRKGKLLVVEGIDGAGKSTLIRELEYALEAAGIRVLVSEWRESKRVGPYIKQLSARGVKICPRAFSALHAADFADRLHRDILPALARGDTVICDRYFYTEISRDAGLGLPESWSVALFPFAPEPDLILHLDVSLATSIERIKKRIKQSGKAGSLNKSLRAALLGSLLGSLDSTTGMMVDARWKPSGEPMTEMDREQIKFGFQVKTRDKYREMFSAKKNVVTLDAEQPQAKVAEEAIQIVKELVLPVMRSFVPQMVEELVGAN